MALRSDDKTHQISWRGKTYAFFSEICMRAFMDDPVRFAIASPSLNAGEPSGLVAAQTKRRLKLARAGLCSSREAPSTRSGTRPRSGEAVALEFFAPAGLGAVVCRTGGTGHGSRSRR